MRNILVVAAGVAVVIAIAAGVYFGTRTPSQAPAQAVAVPAADKAALLAVQPSDHVLGSDKAPITLIEYASFTCPHCAHFATVILPDVKKHDLFDLWQLAKEHGMATANIGLLTDIIACPGLDYCALANARSIPLALELSRRFDDLDYLQDIGPCSIKISGCINACGHHHVGHIGILGINKNGEEAYQLMLGGNDSDSASIGKVLGPALPEDKVCDAVEKVLDLYLKERTDDEETFLACVRRLGLDPFKTAAYGA